MHDLTLKEQSDALRSGKFSSVELTTHYLERIKKLDGQLNSYVTVTEETALQQAKQADKMIAQGKITPLTGIPLAQKDLFCTKGIKTSCGSKMLDNFVAPYDAFIIQRFANAGAVMLGKTNMDEFAMGSSNESSFYGPVKNPWDPERVPGGSSGGSAAAVAGRLAAGATGTDTGGSIRQPAALTNLTGLKPTYGLVSRYGMVAFASSLDQGGPMTQTAEDAAMMLSVMSGFDTNDSTSIDRPVPQYHEQLGQSVAGLKIGVPKEFFGKGLDTRIGAKIEEALLEFEKAGATLVEINLPHTELSVPTYYVIAPAECSSNLARYDGVRYGHRCEEPKDLEDLYCRTRAEAFGDEVKRRVLIGTYVLSAGYYDAFYLQAQKVRRLISQDFANAFQSVDVIAGPTSPTTAFKIGEKSANPLEMYLSDIYTIAVNLAGLPSLSVPAGFVDDLPVGLQLTGNHFDETKLVNMGHCFQQMTDYHTQIPKGFS